MQLVTKLISFLQFRINARPNAMDQTEFAANISAKMLKHLEEYYDVTYPLPKMVITRYLVQITVVFA